MASDVVVSVNSLLTDAIMWLAARRPKGLMSNYLSSNQPITGQRCNLEKLAEGIIIESGCSFGSQFQISLMVSASIVSVN